LSDKASDESFAASSVPFPNRTHQDTDAPNLGDLSERDKVWDKHKSNSDKASEHYAGSQYNRYSQRINICADLLEFRLAPDQVEGVYKLKLSGARFCRVRHCPVCQWRRSLMWKAKAYRILPKVVRDYPKHRWLFLTLTIRNCPIQKLRDSLEQMNKSFTRLSQLKAFPGEGWVKSTEVTRGKDGSAHPHFHVLLMVPASYFSGQDYLSQEKWTELWRQAARLDYKPMTHVRAIAKHHDPQVIVPEILKYQVKESDLVADRQWFLELTKQLHKTRAVAVGGVLRKYLRELEEEPEDLIGEMEEDSEKIDEGSLYFGWKRQVKKYKLTDT
jgi:plasmid rolling circle replication initiator protein Rep